MTDKMTIQEAITELKECYLVQSDDDGRRRNKAVTMAIESLEKQIPKKPVRQYIKDFIEDGVTCQVYYELCPICGHHINRYEEYDWGRTGNKVCGGCGQAIDWNDEDCEECKHFGNADICTKCGLDGNDWFVKKESDTDG